MNIQRKKVFKVSERSDFADSKKFTCNTALETGFTSSFIFEFQKI